MQTKLCHWLLDGGQIIILYFDPRVQGGEGIGYTSVKIKSLSLLKIHQYDAS